MSINRDTFLHTKLTKKRIGGGHLLPDLRDCIQRGGARPARGTTKKSVSHVDEQKHQDEFRSSCKKAAANAAAKAVVAALAGEGVDQDGVVAAAMGHLDYSDEDSDDAFVGQVAAVQTGSDFDVWRKKNGTHDISRDNPV